jgi:hypothetical protein
MRRRSPVPRPGRMGRAACVRLAQRELALSVSLCRSAQPPASPSITPDNASVDDYVVVTAEHDLAGHCWT